MISIIVNVFKCKKKYVTYFLMLVLCFLIMINLINTQQYYKKILEVDVGTKIINRKLVVLNSNDKIISKIESFSNLTDYYPYVYLEGSFDNVNIKLEYVASEEYNLIDGYTIKNKNEIIVSKEMSKYLGKNINVKLFNKTYEFKVVGISDLEFAIVSKDLLRDLIDYFNINIEYYILISNNYKSAETNIDILSQNGYNAFLESNDGLVEYNEMQKFISLLTKFIYFIIFLNFLFIIYIFKSLSLVETKNMAILKAIGYSDFNIGIIFIFKILIVLLISIAFALVFFIGFFGLLNCFISSEYILFTNKFNFLNKYFWLCLISIILLFIDYVPIILKIKKLDVLGILNEE